MIRSYITNEENAWPVLFVFLAVLLELLLLVVPCSSGWITLDCGMGYRILYYIITIPSLVIYLFFVTLLKRVEKRMEIFDRRVYYLAGAASVISSALINAALLVALLQNIFFWT